ncbi:MAG: hypothetical protein N2316_10495 [Spirochaetes bacterium]|nr:hypothetical protein [Spirochaetota bacterium]
MGKKIIIALVMCSALPLAAQEGGFQSVADIEFINHVADLPTARVNDAVTLFTMFYGTHKRDFHTNVAFLRTKGIILPKTVKSDDPLRRGTLALMAAQYLKLSDSFMYRIFSTKRHAVVACIADGIMVLSGSEWDILSGGELVEVMRKIAEKSGGTK